MTIETELPEPIRSLISLRENIAEMAAESPERMLTLGREYAIDTYPNYIEAQYIFDTLSKNKDERIRRTARLYDHVLLGICYPGTRNSKISDIVVKKIISCMAGAKKMHKEQILSKEDLFALDTLIDRVVSENLLIQDRETFERRYCNFKEYVTNVFREGGEK